MAVYGGYAESFVTAFTRQAKKKTTVQWLGYSGPTRNVDRMAVTQYDGYMILPFAYGKDPRDDEANKVGRSFGQLADAAQEGAHDTYRDWELYDWQVYTSPDYNRFFVECGGRSRYFSRLFPNNSWYDNHYLLRIDFKNSKVNDVKEPFNPYAVFKQLGWDKEPLVP